MRTRRLAFLLCALLTLQSLVASASDTRGFSIQVSSTPDEKTARSEVQRLLDQKQPAYLIRSQIPGRGIYYRVRVGRFSAKAAATAHADVMRKNKLISDFFIAAFEGSDTVAVNDATRAPVYARNNNKKPAQSQTSSAAPPVAAPAAQQSMASPPSIAVSSGSAVQREQATRITLERGKSTEISFDESVGSVTIIDTEIVSAEIVCDRRVKLTGTAYGETTLIATGQGARRVFVIRVISHTVKKVAKNNSIVRASAGPVKGSYTLYFMPGSGERPGLLRQRIDYTQKLSDTRTLYISSDMSRRFGKNSGDTTSFLRTGLAVDQMRLGVIGPEGSLELLDSQLQISRIGFDNYLMRGFHLSSSEGSRLGGAEIFAGVAQPSSAFVEQSEGYIAGAFYPFAKRKNLRARGGISAIAPRNDYSRVGGGVALEFDGSYALDNGLGFAGELSLVEDGLSWRARLDFNSREFAAWAEAFNIDRHSPFISIGAQPGGRRLLHAGLQWQPFARLGGSLSYTHSRSTSLISPRGAGLTRESLVATARYNMSGASRFTFELRDQRFDTATSISPFFYRLETRDLTLNHTSRFLDRWSNTLRVRLTSSREAFADSEMDRGILVREELRRNWRRWNLSGFVNYARNTPSLAGLIVRNPILLPPLLREAYQADPARFFEESAGLLASLFAGIGLPQTNNTEYGFRLVSSYSRFTFMSDLRHSSGVIRGTERGGLLYNFGLKLKLDAANMLQVSGSHFLKRSFGGEPSSLNISYTHYFGSAAGDGFQFASLLGLDRGRIEGQAFIDLNLNGGQDAGEPGAAGISIQLDGKRIVVTDSRGHFDFTRLDPGTYTVALLAHDMGERLRATTESEQSLTLARRQTASVSFGITSFGFISGRAFNDLFLAGDSSENMPSVGGMSITLKPSGARDKALTQVTGMNGVYQFNNLLPGIYTLALDLESVPPDFNLPSQTEWEISVEPLKGTYQDVAIRAQRAIAGVVFVDKDGDGRFDEQKDEPVAGAKVSVGNAQTVTDAKGAYILRNLPAGDIEVRAALSSSSQSNAAIVQLGAEPVLLRGVNIAIAR